MTQMHKRYSESAERNKKPLQRVLQRLLPSNAQVLEIASGTGQHASYLAHQLNVASWQPSDIEEVNLESIRAWTRDQAPRVKPPLHIDVHSDLWPVGKVDVIFCCNMVHISPWSASVALFSKATHHLNENGLLLLYGPYCFHGSFTAPSNEKFDHWLRQQNPHWGVRDVNDLELLAQEHSLRLHETIAMPANNHVLVFRPSYRLGGSSS